MAEEKDPFKDALHNFLNIQNLFAPKPKPQLGHGQIKMQPEHRQKAENYLNHIQQQGKSSPLFAHLPLQDFVADLRQRLQDPDGLNQSYLNVCGAATFSRFWLLLDPENFVHTAYDLYINGHSQYRQAPLKANPEMFNQKTSLNKIDWLITASLQNASGYLGYNPAQELGGIRGIALPSKVADWLQNLQPLSLHQPSTPDIDQINLAFSHGGAVAFLVNVNLLDNYFTHPAYRNEDDNLKKQMATLLNALTGNHYVALNSIIEQKGDQIRFDIWTWGTSLEVAMPAADLAPCIKNTFLLRKDFGS